MSLAELLPAIRALPRAEQVQLLHLLVDGVAEAPKPAPVDDLPEQFRAMFPPGFVAWISPQITLDAEGAAAVEAMLAEIKRRQT